MKIKNIITVMAALAVVGFSTQAMAGSCSAGYSKKTADIVETAAKAGSFQTLVAAVKEAGLVDTLKGDGPFTVFAPTDAAFSALPEGTVENLLKPENREQLVSILTYHVVPGKVAAADVANMEAATVNGQTATLTVSNEGVQIEGANVIQTDILTSNGIIHVIDKVILPSA